MILVVLGISIIIFISGLVLDNFSKIDAENIKYVGALLTVISLIVTITLGVVCSSLKVIDNKIAMYEEENTKIEEQIEVAVQQYQEYESNTFANVKNDSVITLVSLYPELKSDTLVKKQIEVYMSNNELIKQLKAEKIDGVVLRWWLYFGG